MCTTKLNCFYQSNSFTDLVVTHKKRYTYSILSYYTVSPKNETDVAHYNFNADQPIW